MDANFRLRRGADFRRVYSAQRRRDGRLMVVHAAASDLDHPRIGFSVSSKVGGSVRRNLVRRRLREAARPLIQASREGVDLVVVARPEASSASFAELDAELRELTGSLIS
ncbi:MAG TPA: ribonuclease P protein component [Candidatus Dormibacteraeota bacterium]|jgi:ribonuclease P protein component|nr:ribonuclease P protein component [Candidatus Dormibacteraeota bacterium]